MRDFVVYFIFGYQSEKINAQKCWATQYFHMSLGKSYNGRMKKVPIVIFNPPFTNIAFGDEDCKMTTKIIVFWKCAGIEYFILLTFTEAVRIDSKTTKRNLS